MSLLRRVVVALALLIGAIVILDVVGVVDTRAVPSSSMEPTLRCSGGTGCSGDAKDRILALKYVFGDPKRGDVVVFHVPRATAVRCGGGGTFVQRIIGLPGERWEERKGFVYVDGRRLDEPYVQARRRDARTVAPTRIPAGRYVVLGDNRSQSCDSRAWGTVARDAIVGKVLLRYWPPTRIGTP
jgi:signal peptidase I